MLLPRILTALVLLAILLPVLAHASPLPFALFGLLMMAAAAWEWGRMNSRFGLNAWMLALLTLALCFIGAQHLPTGDGQTLAHVLHQPNWALPAVAATPLEALQGQGRWWLIAAAFWLLGGPLLLKRGVEAWPRIPSGLRLVLGAAVLTVAWLAMLQLRLLGTNTLLSVMALVWLADSGAYFAGRAFGRRKLAPSISPGKSWEGVAGGWLAVLLLAAVWLWAEGRWPASSPSFYSLLQMRWGWLGMALILALITGMSVVGDLAESLMKRAVGVKDSSRLLPGHGGVLDRIDALLPTFVLAMAALTL